MSELSPAVLYRSELPEMTFFNGIEAWGHGGPTHVAVRTAAGVVVAGRGERIDGALQSEPWLLVWFAGAEGWMFDVPWLIVLEHRPRAIGIDTDGLRVRFDRPGGHLVAMPFYGYYKAPPAGKRWSDLLDGARDFGIETSTWATAFPESVAARAQWWAQVLRRYPVRCTETFRVDRLNDVLTIRSAFEYIDIRDDWGTSPRTLAPLSPTLALALTDEHNTFPMRFSAPVIDPFVMTSHGPYMGIEGQASYEIEFDTLKYINEVERAERPPADAPRLVKEADERLQATAARRWPTADRMAVDHGVENYVWAAMGDRFYPMALPYITDARVRANARESLRKYFGEWVLQKERFTEYQGQEPAWRGVLLLHGPGIGSWGELGDAGKFSENLYSEPLVLCALRQATSARSRRAGISSEGSTSPRSSPGGKDSAATASRRWATRPRRRSTTRVSRGWPATSTPTTTSATSPRASCCTSSSSRTARSTSAQLQPYHQYFADAGSTRSIEPMPANVFISNLHGGLHGWQVDGPPIRASTASGSIRIAGCGSRARQSDASTAIMSGQGNSARSSRTWKARFDGRPEPGPGSQWVRDDPHIMPSLVRLLSLTLDAPIAELETLAVHEGERMPYGQWRLHPDSSVFASAISIIRLSHPRRYDRLIPKSGPPGP